MILSLKRLTWIIEKVNKSYELDDEQKQMARLAILAYLDADAATLKGHEANARRVEAWAQLAGGGSYLPLSEHTRFL